MTAMHDNFVSFEAAAKRGGYTEVIAKDWEPSLVLERHTHPYDVDALLVSGNLALEIDGETRHLVAGDAFQRTLLGAAGGRDLVGREAGGRRTRLLPK